MLLVQKVFAQVTTDPQLPVLGFTTLAQVLGLVINVILGVGIALVIIFLVLGGIQYVMSKGDVKAADAARQSITNAIIGFIVILGALTIKAIVQGILGAGNVTVETITPEF